MDDKAQFLRPQVKRTMNCNMLVDGLSIEALHAGDASRITEHFARLSPYDRALRSTHR